MNRCGFVHMQTQEQADAAIKALNNYQFNGASIVVEHGRMKERPQGGGNGPPRMHGNNSRGGMRQMGGNNFNRGNNMSQNQGMGGNNMGGNNNRQMQGGPGPIRQNRSDSNGRGAPYNKNQQRGGNGNGQGRMNNNNNRGGMNRSGGNQGRHFFYLLDLFLTFFIQADAVISSNVVAQMTVTTRA